MWDISPEVEDERVENKQEKAEKLFHVSSSFEEGRVI
jgi:hypothetical protein